MNLFPSVPLEEMSSLESEFVKQGSINAQMYRKCLEKFKPKLPPCEMHSLRPLIADSDSWKVSYKEQGRLIVFMIPNVEFVVMLSPRLELSEFLVYVGGVIGFWLGLVLMGYLDAFVNVSGRVWPFFKIFQTNKKPNGTSLFVEIERQAQQKSNQPQIA